MSSEGAPPVKPDLGGRGWDEMDCAFVVVKDGLEEHSIHGISVYLHLDYEDGSLDLKNNDGEGAYGAIDIEPAKRLAMAALCLYGLPFGFTHADVDYLREVAEEDGATAEWVANARSLAARVAALLPPREHSR